MGDTLAQEAAGNLQQLYIIPVRGQVDILHIGGDAAVVDLGFDAVDQVDFPDAICIAAGNAARQPQVDFGHVDITFVNTVEVKSIRIAAEDLSDLELIRAEATVERGNGTVVIGEKLVVAIAGADQQTAIDCLVIVDTLYRQGKRGPAVIWIRIDVSLCQVGDEILAQQEYVVGGGIDAVTLRMIPVELVGADRLKSMNAEPVGTVVGHPAILYVDGVRRFVARYIDNVMIVTTAAVQVDRVEHGAVGAVQQQVIWSIMR